MIKNNAFFVTVLLLEVGTDYAVCQHNGKGRLNLSLSLPIVDWCVAMLLLLDLFSTF